MKTKLYALMILAAVSLSTVSVLAACGDNSSAVDTAADPETTAAVTEDPGPKLQLPASDYQGQNFTILSTVHADYEYIAENETGDIVEDAVYARNRAVEELLNIKFSFIAEPGHWADKDTFNALIKNSVMADDGAFDLISGTMVCVLPIASEGVFVNALELEHVNFDNPWWVAGMEEKLAVGGKLFGFVGDASLSLYKDLSVIFFNKKLLNDYSLDDPYELVRSGNWTFDRLIAMTNAVSSDLNGDGKLEPGVDLLGYYYHGVPQRAFQTSMEFQVVDFDDSDMPYIIPLREQDATLYEKVKEYLLSDNVSGIDGIDHADLCAVFTADQTLFLAEFLYGTDYMRDMKSDFGILPMPKRDESQADYHTQIGTSTSLFFVPTTTPDAALTSMVCEALCYYSWRDVVPSYYEVALKEKYTRDEIVKEMLNIIRASADISFTFAYSTTFNPFINTILPNFAYGKSSSVNVASSYEKNIKSWTATIEKLVEAYSNIEG